ncbi:alcohol dehydrogenase-like isoform X2 [Babylonia areolata]|uniref:alcohol dehydrogenase-like isoform X2 n=1 Tax=Babylonia areolata TaxID=304850 RepID=UPI003FD0E978
MLDNEVHHKTNNNMQLLNKPSSMMAHPFSDMCSSASQPVPETPKEGIVVKVEYVGACYSEGKLRRKRMRARFPGMEVAGTIHQVGDSLPNCNFTPGDKVILFPDEQLSNSGYSEYLPVPDTRQVMQVPDDLPLEVAAMLPGGALTAYAALTTAKPHVEKLQQVKSCVNVLVVGAGGLGLWTIRLAQLVMDSLSSGVRLYVADSSIDKLLTAQDHGCHDIIHWNEEDHEEYIVERTLDTCRGGVDIIIDFVSSPRTMQRSLKVLNRSLSLYLTTQEGMVQVGGSSMTEVNISLNALAAKQQSIVGIPKGNMNQLRDLIGLVVEGKLSPPCYAVFPIEDLSQVFDDLCECRITGRAIFRLGHTATVTDNQ